MRSQWVLFAALSIAACDTGPDPSRPTNIADASFAQPIPTPERNPNTAAGVALGRALFYDPILSSDGRVACATCHQQSRAFSDGERISSAGVSGQPLLRHTPTLMNLAWMDGYFWDGGGYDLESQAFGPLDHPDEMNLTLSELVAKLAATARYPPLFAAAFHDGITQPNVVRAIAQFERTLVSDQSKYDAWRRGDTGLSESEMAGFVTFERLCASCHTPPFFTDYGYRNNGLDADFPEDHERLAWGRGRITEDAADMGKYKVPSLRNVEVTAPYMHDGRFATLRDVLNHYRIGVKASPTVDPFLNTEGRLGLDLTEDDVENLLAFLTTLTDPDFLNRPDLARP